MPKLRKDSFLRKDLPGFIAETKQKLSAVIAENNRRIADGVTNDSELVVGLDSVLLFLNNLEELRAMDLSVFGDDGEKTPSADELYQYAEKARACLTGLENLKTFPENDEIKNPDVLSVCQDVAANQADLISLELLPALKAGKPERDWELTDAEKLRADALIGESLTEISGKLGERVQNQTEKYANQNAGWIEFPDEVSVNHFQGNIPYDLQLTGKAGDLAAYYAKNEQKLTEDEKNYLKGRIGSITYFDELEKNSRNKASKPVFTVAPSQTGNGFSLGGYAGKYQYQTTFNGCWSCAYAMLLESRGVSLNQQVVRSFRPDGGVEDMKDTHRDAVRGLVSDEEYSPFELADLTAKVLPNTAMRQIAIDGYEEDDYQSVMEEVRMAVAEALLVDKSPVAITNGQHFVTIVGIEGDEVTILNSQGSEEGLEETVPLDDLISQGQVSLSWLHDLDFTKDGKCVNMPANFGDIRYSGGSLTSLSSNAGEMNRSGSTFSKIRENGNLFINESVYLPNQVPEAVFALENTKAKSHSQSEPQPQPEPQKKEESQAEPELKEEQAAEPQPEPQKKEEPQAEPELKEEQAAEPWPNEQQEQNPQIQKKIYTETNNFTDQLPKIIFDQLSKYNADELRSRMSSDPEVLMKELMKEAYIPEQDLDDDVARDMVKELLPGYKIPKNNVLEEREKQREELGRRLYKSMLNRQLLLVKYNAQSALTRQERSMYDYTGANNGLTEEFLKHKANPAASAGEGDDIFLRQLRAFNEFDLTKIDPTDANTILDHPEEALFIANFGWEMEKICEAINRRSDDFRAQPEVEEFSRRAPQMLEYGMVLKQSIEALVNPLYKYVGLYDDPRMLNIDFDRQASKRDTRSLSEKYGMNPKMRELSPVTERYVGNLMNLSMFSKSGNLSPLYNTSLGSMEDRLAAIPEKENLKINTVNVKEDPQRTVGTASADAFDENITLPEITKPETRIMLNMLYQGQPGSKEHSFDYYNRDLYSRIFVKNEKNYFVPAFPDAQKKEWKGPTAEELDKLAASNKNYGYFSPGASNFLLIQNGSASDVKPDTDYILFGEAGIRRLSGRLSADEAKRFANEKRINELKQSLIGFERVTATETSIFGSKMEDRGNDQFRNFNQRFNDYFSKQPGTVYPSSEPAGKLREDDIAAMTMLKVMSPSVSGSLLDGVEPDANVSATFDMSISDLFIQRSEPSTKYWTSTVTARQQLAKALGTYYSENDMTGLAETIADGFHYMVISAANKDNLGGVSASRMIPLAMTMNMLKRDSNSDLLEAAKAVLQKRGDNELRTFNEDWKKAETICKLYEHQKKAYEEELRLLRYENGQLSDEQGNTLNPTDEEREQLHADAERARFYSEVCSIHTGFCHRMVPEEAQQRMISEIVNNMENARAILEEKKLRDGIDYTENDLLAKKTELDSASQVKVDYIQTAMPMSPVFSILMEHDAGQKILDAMLRETPDTKKLYERLEDEGLIPLNGGLDGYDPAFYEKNITNYAKWMDKEAQFKEDWQKNADFFKEQGLEYDEVASMMKTGQIESVEAFRKNIEAREEEAVAEFEDNGMTRSEKIIHELNSILADDAPEPMNGVDLCGAFKTINALSKENENNPMTVYVASQMMRKVCERIAEFTSNNPENQKVISRYLDTDDFVRAKYTINRGNVVKADAERQMRVQNGQAKEEKRISKTDQKLPS